MEILLDIKFLRTIDILLTNKWNDQIITEDLRVISKELEDNFKVMK